MKNNTCLIAVEIQKLWAMFACGVVKVKLLSHAYMYVTCTCPHPELISHVTNPLLAKAGDITNPIMFQSIFKFIARSQGLKLALSLGDLGNAVIRSQNHSLKELIANGLSSETFKLPGVTLLPRPLPPPPSLFVDMGVQPADGLTALTDELPPLPSQSTPWWSESNVSSSSFKETSA